MKRSDSLTQRYLQFQDKLNHAITFLEELMEDPLFLDSIHGEQEIGMDQAIELLDGICAEFDPVAEPTAPEQAYEGETFDVD